MDRKWKINGKGKTDRFFKNKILFGLHKVQGTSVLSYEQKLIKKKKQPFLISVLRLRKNTLDGRKKCVRSFQFLQQSEFSYNTNIEKKSGVFFLFQFRSVTAKKIQVQ